VVCNEERGITMGSFYRFILRIELNREVPDAIYYHTIVVWQESTRAKVSAFIGNADINFLASRGIHGHFGTSYRDRGFSDGRVSTVKNCAM
jgi:hypothetical protein